jgi:uncharacterized protein YndB with AHSA1/START domain
MIEVEHDEVLPYPAATVFAALTDLESRKDWQPDLVDIRVNPAGPTQVGSRVYEARNFKGHSTEATRVVSVCEQDKLLVLDTVGEAKQPTIERYQIEDLADGTCRLHYRTEMDGVPEMAQHFVRQGVITQLPDYFQRLTKIIEGKV